MPGKHYLLCLLSRFSYLFRCITAHGHLFTFRGSYVILTHFCGDDQYPINQLPMVTATQRSSLFLRLFQKLNDPIAKLLIFLLTIWRKVDTLCPQYSCTYVWGIFSGNPAPRRTISTHSSTATCKRS